jgi:hypothetical protein
MPLSDLLVALVGGLLVFLTDVEMGFRPGW